MLKGEHEKKGSLSRLPLSIFCCKQLLAQAKSLNDGTVAIDIALLQVLQQAAALTYQHSQCSFSAIILLVDLQMLSQVRDTV